MNNKSSSSGRRQDATAIITSGPIWSAVWYLTWPSAISTFIMTFYNIVNRIFLGHVPAAEASLAASGIGGNALNFQMALLFGLSAGTSALVSRSIGENRLKDAVQAARQSIILSVLAAILTGIPLALCAKYLVMAIGAAGDVVALATSYTAIISWASIPLFVNMIATAILRSQGDVRSPLYSVAAVIVVNVLLDWLLIFGIDGLIQPMGIRGAAIATGVSRVVGMTLTLWFVRRSKLGEALSHWRLDLRWLVRIFNIGWPASAQNLVMTLGSAGYLRILGMLPSGQATAAQAAYTVALALEALAFQPGIAYSMAAPPMVGQNLGAGKPQRAIKSAWVAAGQAAAIMGLIASLFLIIPQYLAKPFSSDVALVPIIVAYLRINSFSEPFLALNMVLRGALQGAGNTFVPFILTSFSLLFVRLPLEWLLAIHLKMGASGAWWSMSITACLGGLLMAAWFKFGNWRETKV
ncbi:MAG: MATE family efflux transporter [Armatimonadetes bacterium]|nr:MATE family efflux transporter [Armatimonadota bacterium]